VQKKVDEADFYDKHGERNEPWTSKTEVPATGWQMRRFFASLRMTQETSSAQSYPAGRGITLPYPLQADLHPHPRPRTGGACIQPQRGGLAKPRPTAWVRKVTAFLVLKPRRGVIKTACLASATLRVHPGVLFRPFRACGQTGRGSRTQAVGLGCGSPPLRGWFWHRRKLIPLRAGLVCRSRLSGAILKRFSPRVKEQVIGNRLRGAAGSAELSRHLLARRLGLPAR